MNSRFALLITWTTYGTWLPGDKRGHVSPVLQRDGNYAERKNTFQTEFADGDDLCKERARQLQKFATVWLNPKQAQTAADGLVKAAASRGWMIHRAAVMANHFHVVVEGCPADGPAVRRVLKGVSQAALSGKRRWWTGGGSVGS